MMKKTYSKICTPRIIKTILILALFLLANSVFAHGGIESGFANVNGVDIYYELEGEGMPILLMHGGLGADHWTFHWPGTASLADSYKLVYYDHRANGRSGGEPNTATFANLSKDAEFLRQSLGLGKVVVLGYSYGGFIAQRYILDYPNSVAALILYSTGPNFKSVFAGTYPPDLAKRTCGSKDYFYSEEICLKVEKEDQTINKNVTYACDNEWGNLDYTPRLNEINVPTLILDGKYDFVFPLKDQEAMRDNIKNSRLVIFEKSGHSADFEEAEAFQQTIRDFLGTTSVSPRSNVVSTWGSIKAIR